MLSLNKSDKKENFAIQILKKSDHLFFDLDHTLWDFETNAEESLLELYDHYKMDQYGKSTAQDFVNIYRKVNDSLWAKYRKHHISKQELRTSRFEISFQRMGFKPSEVPEGIWEHYIELCPTKTHLIPGAVELLDYLTPFYRLHLITNGFAETQKRKLANTGLADYFESLTISEEVGAQKPSEKIFQSALKTSGCSDKHGHYVGDHLEADVKGGLNAGWQVYWLQSAESEESFEHERLITVKSLSELKAHF